MSDGTAAPGRPGESTLVERERELALLDATLTAATEGRAAVVVVEGPAGIGKTRLLTEARRRAATSQMVALAARGSELELGFSFGIVRQLFERRLVDPRVRARALTGVAAAALAIFAEVEEQEPVETGGDPSFASLHGLYRLVANLCVDSPMLVVVDDLHWCDRPSLRFLGYLARRLEDLPLLIVCGIRPAERGPDRALLGELFVDHPTVVIRPHPLSRTAVATLVGERLGARPDREFSDACHAATEGNPLLLDELVKELDAEGATPDAGHVGIVGDLGPRAASRTVLLRLARLAPEAAAVARAAAVLGDGADLQRLAELSGLDEAELERGLDALVHAEILRAEPELGFVHPLVGAAVYRDIQPLVRGREHRRAARLLATAGAPAEQVAAQLAATPPAGEDWAVAALLRAARRSLRLGAPDSAVAYLDRALAEPPAAERRVEVLLELGRTELLTHGPHAATHLSAAHDALDDPVRRAQVARTLARVLLVTGRASDVGPLAHRALAELPAGCEELATELECVQAMGAFTSGRGTERLQRLRSLRARPVGSGAGAKMLATVVAREWTFAGGSSEECAALALRALSAGELVEADNAHLAVIAITTLARADRDEALGQWDAALAEAHRRGSLLAKAGISLGIGFTMYRRGRLIDAERSLREAIEEFTLWWLGSDLRPAHSVSLLAVVLAERGRLAEARSELDRVRDPGDGSEGARYRCYAELELLVREREHERAAALADEFGRRFAHVVNPVDTPWRSYAAIALDGLGRREQALAIAGEYLALARRWGAPGAVARALRVLGTLQRDRGIERLQEAVATAADTPARLEHAKALLALGRALRHARQPRSARRPLRDAIEVGERCGAEGLLAESRAELAAAGGRPRAKHLSGVESLTAGERRVASLAADGQSNREIAQILFLSPKTVEMHLGNTYRKLGIDSRRQLPDAIGESQSEPDAAAPA